MPNRVILSAWVRDPRRAKLSAWADDLVLLLALVVDDFRVTEAEPLLVLRDCYPRRRDISEAQISRLLEELEQTEILILYEARGRPYLQLCEGIMQVNYASKRRKHPPPPRQKDQAELDLGPPEDDSGEKILSMVGGESESRVGVASEGEVETESCGAASRMEDGKWKMEKDSKTRQLSDEEKRRSGRFARDREAFGHPTWWALCARLGEKEMHDNGAQWAARFKYDSDAIHTILSDFEAHRSGPDGRKVEAVAAWFEEAWQNSPACRRWERTLKSITG